eukprot:1999713-Rhodomonas_salina.1
MHVPGGKRRVSTRGGGEGYRDHVALACLRVLGARCLVLLRRDLHRRLSAPSTPATSEPANAPRGGEGGAQEGEAGQAWQGRRWEKGGRE